jgi:hypothetical protein
MVLRASKRILADRGATALLPDDADQREPARLILFECLARFVTRHCYGVDIHNFLSFTD